MRPNNTARIAAGTALAAALLLASCRSQREAAAPQADTQAMYRGADTAAADTATIADMPWNSFFADSFLQALIQEGLAGNYDLQIAQLRTEQAGAALMMARAALLPTLSAGVQTSQYRISSGTDGTKILGYSAPSSSNQIGFVASWEIDVWGKLRNQKQAKLAAFRNTQEYRTLVQTNLIAAIASSYYSLLALDEQLRVTLQSIDLLRSNAETMQYLLQAGMQNAAAVESSRAALYSAQLSLPTLQSQITKLENAISLLIGRAPGPIARGDISAQPLPASLSVGVPAQLLARRPDVIQAELSFRQAYALTGAARASLYPSFTISSASLGFAGEFSTIFRPEHIAGSLMASVMQPIFFKKQLRGNLQIARSQQEEALLYFKSTVLKAGQEVSTLLDSYQSSIQKDELRRQQVQSLSRSVEYTKELLSAGEASYLEVLNAQNGLLAAQMGQVSDRLEQLSYSVSLYKALGGGR